MTVTIGTSEILLANLLIDEKERTRKAELLAQRTATFERILENQPLPDDDGRIREIKLDGYRAIAFKSVGKIYLRSRNDNNMNTRYPPIAEALEKPPDNTVVDGELVALDEDDRPSFSLLQNYGSASGPLLFFIFDLLVLSDRDLKEESHEARSALLEKKVMPRLADPIRLPPALEGNMKELIASVKTADWKDSSRSARIVSTSRAFAQACGARCELTWGRSSSSADIRKVLRTSMRWQFGFYEGKRLVYSARVRNGFTPATREKLFEVLKPYESDKCPFANLSELKSGRWGAGLTAAKDERLPLAVMPDAA